MPNFNFHGLDTSGFPPLPPGIYLSKVSECKKEQTKSGSEMWTVVHEIHDGPQGAPDPTYKNRKVWDRLVWGGGGLGKVKLMLKAFGFDVEQDMEVDWRPEHLLNRTVLIQVTNGSYNGKVTNDIPYNGYFGLEEAGVGAATGGSGPAKTSPTTKDEDVPF